MEEQICPNCFSNELQYDEFWNDKTYICSNCGLEDIYLKDKEGE